MAVSEAHKKASYKYNASRDSITLRPTKEDGEIVRSAAAASGQSLQNFIMDACFQRIAREQHKSE